MIVFARPWLLLLLLAAPAAVLVGRTRRGCRRRALILRTASLALLALAAAGPRLTAPSDRVDAVFVVDASDSLGVEGTDAGIAEVNRLLGGMRGDDTAGLVTVASSAVVEAPPRPSVSTFRGEAMHDGSSSALAEGLYAAAALLPPGGGERRILLVSDGRDTGGGLDEAVRFARNSGVLVDVLPAGPSVDGEVVVTGLEVPAAVNRNEVHELTASIRSDHSSFVRAVILRNGEYVGEDRFSLVAGEQRRTWEMPGAEPGAAVYEVIVDAEVDGDPGNNRGLAVTAVRGSSGILWVGRGRSALPSALESQGLEVRRIAPGDLPDRLSDYAALDGIILDNVSARELSLRTQDLLETWVRSHGGGLMMIGGDASYGLGGYFGTPVERILPVDMDAPSSLYIPSLAMVMVIDKSGSMGGEVGSGLTKLDLVKDAVLGAVDVLNPLYTVGMVAFDANAEWTIPPTEAGNRTEIRTRLDALESGGGTVLYPAIREAYERLVQSPAAVRHLVILSDGLAEAADYGPLMDAIRTDGITVSTVAVGNDADAGLMERLAEEGGGRYWFAEDATQVPRIFASESMIVSRGLTVEETVFPEPGMPAEALEGLDLSFVPPLHGYVMTYADPTAVEALRSPRGHPLLVYGRCGLGRSVAFMSDLRGGWGRDWVSWERLPRLLAQSVRWMRRDPGLADLTLGLREEEGDVVLSLEARAESGGYRSDLKAVGRIVGPDQVERAVPMHLTSPGLYEGRFRPDADGVYRVTAGDDVAGETAEAYWTRAYSPERGASGVDAARLAEVSRIGGGRLLAAGTEDAAAWWSVRSPSNRTLADMAPWLAFAALLLLLADIALREGALFRREGKPAAAAAPSAPEDLVIRGIALESGKSGRRRPTPAEAARMLAEKRAGREREMRERERR